MISLDAGHMNVASDMCRVLHVCHVRTAQRHISKCMHTYVNIYAQTLLCTNRHKRFSPTETLFECSREHVFVYIHIFTGSSQHGHDLKPARISKGGEGMRTPNIHCGSGAGRGTARACWHGVAVHVFSANFV